MLQRILSGVIGITFIVLVILFSSSVPIIIDILISLVCVVAIVEFANATRTFKLFQLSIPSMVFSFIYPMLLDYDMGTMIWYIYTAIMLSMMIFNHKKITFIEFAYIYSMTIIITVSLSGIITMKDMDVVHSSFYFVLTLALPWLADAGAYFIGTLMGKHKLCPDISPKKTIEGAIGGSIICILVMCFVGYIFSSWIYGGTVDVNYLHLALLSLFGSVISILGDLSFSLVKRTFQIKDYGNLIPGHGGVLDRFDSVVFVTPFLLIMITYLPVLVI